MLFRPAAALAVTVATVACTDEPVEPATPEGYEPCRPLVDAPMGEYSLRRIGNPQFCPVDGSVAAMLIGSPPVTDHIREVAETVLPDHEWDSSRSTYNFSTGHPPPYTGELPAGLAAAGAQISTTFQSGQATAPLGLVVSAMLIPSATAPSGEALDFEFGPIMSRQIFPITVNMSLLHEENGQWVTVDSGTATPAVPAFQGSSHQPILNIEQSDTPAPSGRYVVRLLMTEVRGTDAYELHLPFTIE